LGDVPLSELTAAEWSEVLQSVIRKDKEYDCGYNRRPVPAAFQKLPNHTLTARSKLSGHIVNNLCKVVALGGFLGNRRDAGTSTRMREGFELAIAHLSGSKENGWANVLEKMILFAYIVGGVLRRGMLEKAMSRKDVKERFREFLRIRYRFARR
jgi:hypothetical protein